ncbi:ferredoxin [[Mycobacterium] burgundiense]|jgi:ferredoxin|uniref:Ferredoxin n=1 Tax=[Mycobacterium] burgundiense TaxID=3064286 RepID=A0ABM9LAM3_9MYCO|nr:ferredoxin [Mycolicibacterium sp. MU0053]CAJ1495752.1 ferredoxin [Mycolicibacterium sp. MU0053]
MRVKVDRDRCEGNAICVGIAPQVFDLDDDEYAVTKVDVIPADQEDLAAQAVAECPRAALSQED